MKQSTRQFTLCIDQTGNDSPLILGKAHRIVPDARAAKDDFVQIINGSGEHHLFDNHRLPFVDFPAALRKKIPAMQNAS